MRLLPRAVSLLLLALACLVMFLVGRSVAYGMRGDGWSVCDRKCQRAAVSPPSFRHAARMFVTAYCLRGHTASGTPVGWGTIAVDPAVIPMRSRVWVQGYGHGVALDTGSAVRGYHVDVWMSSCSAALRSTHYGIVRW
jgi:3D (Asp-Asp-Asp) domain-containing protein